MKAVLRRRRALALRAALVAAIVVSGVVIAPSLHVTASPATSTPKTDWRGNDLSNLGQLSSSGPTVAPSVVFTAPVPGINGDNTGGIELGPGTGSAPYGIVFTESNGKLLKYNPNGSLVWSASGGSGFAGNATAGSGPSQPVLSADGNWYIGDDNGNVEQINDATGAETTLVSGLTANPIVATPKIAADGSLYVGGQDGSLSQIATPSGSITNQFFASTGSTQNRGPFNGKRSHCPCNYLGEPAIDNTSGDLFVATTDSPPSGVPNALGTLYRISSDLSTVRWTQSLLGASTGAIAYTQSSVPGPNVPLVIVADQGPEIAAFNATTGAVVWSDFAPTIATDNIIGSPAVDLTHNVVYVANNSNKIYAINLATGAVIASQTTNGTNSSPILDAAGNVYVVDLLGHLTAYSSSLAAQLFQVSTAVGAPGFMSPAIATGGAVYIGGNQGQVLGLAFTPPTPTPTNTPTSTPKPTNTPTATPTCVVPLTVKAPATVVSGGTLPITVTTSAHAAISGTLKVKTTLIGQFSGTANASGQFTAKLHITYNPPKATKATLKVTATTGCGSATKTSTVTIQHKRSPVNGPESQWIRDVAQTRLRASSAHSSPVAQLVRKRNL